MNPPPSPAKRPRHALTVLNGLLTASLFYAQFIASWPARGQTSAATPKPVPKSNVEKAAAAGLNKRDWKTQKRERQRQEMLKKMERRAQGTPSAKLTPPPAPLTSPRAGQLAEDFDREGGWEQKNNRSFGYARTNHLASTGCAAGEIGGSVSESGVAWFADNVASDWALLDGATPLSASGWCTFTAMQGQASVGWFNAGTHSASHRAVDPFIGWRQSGAAIHPALGLTGDSYQMGKPLAVANDKPFQWALTYEAAGGANGCGQITLTVGGASSMLSLTREEKDALAARKLNRFGIVTSQADFRTSTLWLDNLTYTRIARLPVPHPAAVAHTRTAFFDTDPTGTTFVGVNNLNPHEPVTVVQNYGYQPKGGRTGGCVGGQFSPAIGLSYYGYDYAEKQLHFSDKLRSEGWLQVPSYDGRVLHLGWTSKQGMSWHEPSTVAMRISSIGIKGKGRCINIAAEGTLKNYEGHGGAGWGTITTIPAGPEWHHYVMELDPAGAHGLGTFTVQIDDTSKVFYFGEDKLKKGGDIDIFGMWNGKLPAEEGAITAFVDDVTNTTNGQRDPASNDFNSTPAGWTGRNNSIIAKDYIVRPYHQFGWAGSLLYLDGLNGYSPMYNIAKTDRHCMGGIIYLASYDNLNVPRASYGADLNGTLNTKENHFYATGRMKIDWANVDAGELVGWFNSATACDQTTGGKGHGLPNKFLGVKVTAGSNGYGMIPAGRSPLKPDEQVLKAWNPATRVYEDGEWREFYMEYDPDGAGGRGQFKMQIGKDGSVVTYDLEEGAKGADFAFDRFGLLTMRKGGGKPHAIYFDALTYTVAR